MDSLENIYNKIINLNNLLDRKLILLKDLLTISQNQSKIFKYDAEETKSLIDMSLKEKQAIIDELIDIDNMFLDIFESFSGELNENKNIFKDDILVIKEKIEKITGLDLKIRLEEEKNRQILLSPNSYSFEKISTLKTSKQDLLKKYSQNNKPR